MNLKLDVGRKSVAPSAEWDFHTADNATLIRPTLLSYRNQRHCMHPSFVGLNSDGKISDCGLSLTLSSKREREQTPFLPCGRNNP